jgi:hypothetical protein
MANANGVHHNLLSIGIEGGDPAWPTERPFSEGSGIDPRGGFYSGNAPRNRDVGTPTSDERSARDVNAALAPIHCSADGMQRARRLMRR